MFASDSRTNAGVDHVATHKKMSIFVLEKDRCITILTAGSLATSQAVISKVKSHLQDAEATFNLNKAKYLHEVADYLGQLCQAEQCKHEDAMKKSKMSAESTFIVGGQINGQECEIYHVYPQGNYVTASEETPYLQIGESKYGKPVLDRFIRPATTLEDAARCAVISLDSTIRSNISVAPPIELAIHTNNLFEEPYTQTFTTNSPMYKSIQKQWNEGLKRTFNLLPRFEWEKNLE